MEKLVKKKDVALNRRVRNRDIEEIDRLCFVLKNGSKSEQYKAQAKILEFFDSYLEKYVNLFVGANVDLSNYDTRGFLGMFLTGRPKTPSNLSHQKLYISKVMSRFTREDIKSELTLLFLTVLSKYKIVEGVNALNPLTKIFRWRVKDWFNKIVKDPLFKTVEPKMDDDSNFSIENFIDSINHYEPNYEDVDTKLNLSWILRPNQSLYHCLTRYDRYLLSLIYDQNLPITTVAEKLHRDKDTIKRHIKAALDKLEDKVSNAAESDG